MIKMKFVNEQLIGFGDISDEKIVYDGREKGVPTAIFPKKNLKFSSSDFCTMGIFDPTI